MFQEIYDQFRESLIGLLKSADITSSITQFQATSAESAREGIDRAILDVTSDASDNEIFSEIQQLAHNTHVLITSTSLNPAGFSSPQEQSQPEENKPPTPSKAAEVIEEPIVKPELSLDEQLTAAAQRTAEAVKRAKL